MLSIRTVYKMQENLLIGSKFQIQYRTCSHSLACVCVQIENITCSFNNIMQNKYTKCPKPSTGWKWIHYVFKSSQSMTSLEYLMGYCNRPVCTDYKCNCDTLQHDSQSTFSCLFIPYLPSKCYYPCTSIFKNKLSLMEMMGQKHRLSICLYRFSHK